jgi:hypothetical protein
MVSMAYPCAFFFALMIHKSVTCAMFPNKPGVPLTEKINYTCTFFWRRDLPIFSFLAHEYFTRFICVVCFPRPSFKFRGAIFIRRVISEFIPPTTSPPIKFPQYLPPPPSPYRQLKPPPPQPQLQPHLRSSWIQSGNPPISITASA